VQRYTRLSKTSSKLCTAPLSAGSDIWDPATKTYVGRYNNMGENAPFLPINQPLFDASDFGGYYPGDQQMALAACLMMLHCTLLTL
jgi:hypothetical protein